MNHLGGSHSVVIPLTNVSCVLCLPDSGNTDAGTAWRPGEECVRGGPLREVAAAEGRME